MYRFFHPLLSIGPGMDFPIDHDLSTEKMNLSAIEQQYKKDMSETSLHDTSTTDSLQRLESHIHLVESAIIQVRQHMNELYAAINSPGCFPSKYFFLSDAIYFSHINPHAYFLFAPLGYDAWMEKQLFCIVELIADTAKKEIRHCAFGFSSKEIDSLLLYPLDLHTELAKFDTMETIEASQAHMEYCQKLLLDYFHAGEFYDLYEIEESHLLKYIGDPLVLLRTIQKKHNDNRIKLSLTTHFSRQIDQTLIELIHVERRVVKQGQLQRFWSREQFDAYTAQLQYTKLRLMMASGISQEQLDIFMGYMPADFL